MIYDINDIKYSRGFLGDATKEMGPFQSMQYGTMIRIISSWYDDGAVFADAGGPWFNRGGDYALGCEAGIFNFGNSYGSADGVISFRLVLAF